MRAKSLLIDFLLTSVCLSHGDDARFIVAVLRVGYDNYSTGEKAQGEKPFLPIIETVIYESHVRPGQYLLGVREIQTLLGEVAAVLRLVPFRISPMQ
jgi:hypothetical protein